MKTGFHSPCAIFSPPFSEWPERALKVYLTSETKPKVHCAHIIPHKAIVNNYELFIFSFGRSTRPL